MHEFKGLSHFRIALFAILSQCKCGENDKSLYSKYRNSKQFF